ncbi:carbohydrate ABC transporter permease [Amnibacterium kyonggiense]|uniref:Multiple sugar transport system permease protein n=1 Tax=Amnibacterium kyonggiense TaxID=595671 RepID=A0A4V3EAZ0_9MICO|nr:carbohydrate ABC transporter permease [Amnibacterium kyonggiense]TDS79554.1 multiple sugar transport system permease protein [Amnibacterium kyonggiense]
MPIASPVATVVQQSAFQGGVLPMLAGLAADPQTRTWFVNSLAVSAATVLLAVGIGAPAGYVIARGRSRAVDGFALIVFAMQALPAVILLVPLFVLLAVAHLVDSLPALTLVYAGSTVAIATWTMSSAIESVPVSLEEAAWLDGCSVLTGFVRVVLPNALGGVLGTAVLAFLFAWNEYLVAVVLLTSTSNWTVGLGVISGRSAALGVVAMLPPLLVFAVLHRFFRFGGVAGAVVR